MKQDLITHGSIIDSMPSLEYPKDDQPAPPGEIGLFLSGIEITLKHGKGDTRFQFSFHHMNTGGPGNIIFRGNTYDLADSKRDFFDALSAAIAEELKQPNVKSPNKKFFRI